MPTPSRGPRLGSGPAHERLMLANLAGALFEHGRITTTVAKAKRLRPVAERLITFAKRGDLAARRRVLTVVRDKSVVHTLFAEIGPSYAERAGGYTRITKLGPRKGDNAPMATIELVEGVGAAQEVVGEGERARGTRFARRRRPTGATAEAAADLAPESATAAAVAAEAEAAGGEEPVAAEAAGGEEPVAAEPGEAAAEPEGGPAAEATQPVQDEVAGEPGAVGAAPAAEGDVAAEPTPSAEQVAVPTEGGDTEVVTETTTPEQAASADEQPQAEGERES